MQNAFLIGVAGAFVVYIFMYRETRIREFAENPGRNWMLVLVDVFLFLLAGGLVAEFALNQPTRVQAFMTGATWQGIVGGMISGIENSTLRGEIKEVNGKLTSVMQDVNRWRVRAAVYDDAEEEMQAAPAE
jgi:uncharacterized membrane protein